MDTMDGDRRLNTRIRATASDYWQRWIRMSLVRRVIAVAVTAAVGGGLTFTACQADSITGPSTRAGATPGAATDLFPGELEAVALQTMFQQDDYNPCRSEYVHTDGRVNSFFNVTVASPDKYNIKVHYNTQGNTGFTIVAPAPDPVTPPTPTDPIVYYKVIENDDAEQHFDGVTLPFNAQYTAKTWLRRDGESGSKSPSDPTDADAGDDYFEHIVMHFTVSLDLLSPDGVTVDQQVAKVETRCQ